MKRHWLTMNLDPTRTRLYSIRELAEDHDIARGTVANACTKQRWYDTLKHEREKQHTRVLGALLRCFRDLDDQLSRRVGLLCRGKS